MRILALLFFIIFFPIKTFAMSFEECQMEYFICHSAGGGECNAWNVMKTDCENSYGSRLISDSGGSGGVGQLPRIEVEAIRPSPFPSINDP